MGGFDGTERLTTLRYVLFTLIRVRDSESLLIYAPPKGARIQSPNAVFVVSTIGICCEPQQNIMQTAT